MAAEDRIQGYASAIFEVARGEGNLEHVESELFQIARTFETSADLREALTDPRLPHDRKQGIVDDLLGTHASDLTVSLVGFIVSSGHASELPEIVDGFVARAAAERHRGQPGHPGPQGFAQLRQPRLRQHLGPRHHRHQHRGGAPHGE